MKNIVITGASKGIGFETVLTLANQGHTVIATARSLDKLNALPVKSAAGRIIPVAADLSSETGISPILEEAWKLPRVDVLINNAGTLINKPFMDTSLKDWNYLLEVNLLSAVRLVKALKPNFGEGSHIVNISSMGGFQGSEKFPGLAAYSTSKGALSILTECLSAEFSGDGIAVNCLCLGAVQTEMLSEAFPGYEAPVQPEEMAAFISDFAINAHKYMNGRVLPVALNNPG